MKQFWIFILVALITMTGLISLIMSGFLRGSNWRFLLYVISMPTMFFPCISYWVRYFENLFKINDNG